MLLTPGSEGYDVMFNEINHWFDDIATIWGPHLLQRKRFAEIKRAFSRYRIDEVFNIDPTMNLEEERLIKGLIFSKKYICLSSYARIGISPVDSKTRLRELKKYDIVMNGGESQTHYEASQAFALRLNLPWPNPNSPFVDLPRFPSSLIPSKPYFCLFLNKFSDFREPPLGVVLDVLTFIAETKEDWNLVLLGGHGDYRTGCVISAVGQERVINLRAKTALQDYIELIARARLLISAETSACHIANAYKTNSILFRTGIYGDSLFPYQWGHGVAGQLIIKADFPCSGCHRPDFGHQKAEECQRAKTKIMCLDCLSASSTIDAIRPFLETC